MAQPWLLYPEDVIKLLVAFFLGGLLGLEREFHHKYAGLRTIILICVGAALFTIFSYRLAGDNDPTRIAAAIVSGVGFLGAGVIIHEGGAVRGLTTASTIWLAAAVGIGSGGGYLLFSLIATLLALLVLWGLPRIERQIEGLRVVRTFRVTTAADPTVRDHVRDQFLRAGLMVQQESEEKRQADMTTAWIARGSPEAHRRLVDSLLADPQVLAYEASLPG
jgi:putative Mg2+ transporter-C (MgtC) family protein